MSACDAKMRRVLGPRKGQHAKALSFQPPLGFLGERTKSPEANCFDLGKCTGRNESLSLTLGGHGWLNSPFFGNPAQRRNDAVLFVEIVSRGVV